MSESDTSRKQHENERPDQIKGKTKRKQTTSKRRRKRNTTSIYAQTSGVREIETKQRETTLRTEHIFIASASV